MTKPKPSSGSRKSPASKSRPAKKAATPKATSKPKSAATKPLLEPVGKASPDVYSSPVPLIAEINIPADQPEPRVPIKEWTMWGSIRQLIGGWAK